ncbi:MAG TPA: hypothetical protein VFV51_13550 [Vicinamibacterales bacterium]|nr:hypothetical protein [Vicinamibacterales bacterium]
MATPQSLIAAIDQIIAFFNARKMDLPDGFLDRKTQFVINGAAFETLLGQNPNDALILMLTRGPAGLRFTAKGLQHALVDSHLDRGDVTVDGAEVKTRLWLSGRLRDSGESVDEVVDVTMRLNAAGLIESAAATMNAAMLEKIRQARRS